MRWAAGWLGGLAAMAAAAGAQAQETRLEAAGGAGGTPFTSVCPADMTFVGLEVRAGNYIDAVRALCQRGYRTPPEPVGGFAGGPGGAPRVLACPSRMNSRFPEWRQPLTGAHWSAAGRDLVIMRSIALYCGDNPFSRPADVRYVGQEKLDVPIGAPFGEGIRRKQACPAGMRAVGVHGRAGDFVDAIGLVCARGRIGGFGRVAPACTRAKRAQGRVPAPEYDRLVDACLATIADPGGQTDNPCVRAKRTRGREAFNGWFGQCLATFPD